MTKMGLMLLALWTAAAGCSRMEAPKDRAEPGEPADLVLEMPTADGLKRGDPIVQDGKKVGEVLRVWPHVDRVRAGIRLTSGYRPPSDAQFLLERGEDEERRIQVSRGGGPAPGRQGDPARALVLTEALEDRLWAAK